MPWPSTDSFSFSRSAPPWSGRSTTVRAPTRWLVTKNQCRAMPRPGDGLHCAADRAVFGAAVGAGAAELQPCVAEALAVRMFPRSSRFHSIRLLRSPSGSTGAPTARRRAEMAGSARAPWTCRAVVGRAAATGRRGSGIPRCRSRRGHQAARSGCQRSRWVDRCDHFRLPSGIVGVVSWYRPIAGRASTDAAHPPRPRRAAGRAASSSAMVSSSSSAPGSVTPRRQ